MPTYTKEAIQNLLATNDWAVARGLEALYLRQTADEQEEQTTSYRNGAGFNGRDAGILSSFACQIADWRAEKAANGRTRFPFPLSPKQLEIARRSIRKYSGQLADIANVKAVGNDPVAQAALASEQDAAREARDAAREAQKAVEKAARDAAREVELAEYHAKQDAKKAAIEAELVVAELAAERAAIQAVEAEDELVEFGYIVEPWPTDVPVGEPVAVGADDDDEYLSL